ncbi:splicing factor C9orf78 [Arctopsyche grandis]|uniref:splicing factor C9orf78 n=1 Tax=Arctopsyche grandis TaxID=121162 RepID=UPI00406D9CEF
MEETSTCSDDSQSVPVKFKPTKKKALRRRRQSSSDSDEPENEVETLSKLEETKEIQRLRKRPNGVNVYGLAMGAKISLAEELTCKDPYKIKSGGMVNMKALKSGKVKQVDDAYDTGIGTQFSAETNKRDEDEEMMKYIDEQLAKRKGDSDVSKDTTDPNKYLSPEEAALQALPEHLRQSSASKSEEMLSNQMLSGIPEVDLGIDAKIKNIEATEDAKLRLLWERRNKQEGPSQFVPTNMAVNFVQHNRFNIDTDPPKRKRVVNEEKAEAKPVISNVEQSNKNKKDKGERATDDYHYEKFKKQFRRY